MEKELHCCLVLFVKYPGAGQVKTRLARDIGQEEAAGIYQNFILDLTELLGSLNIPVCIAVNSGQYLDYFKEWLGDRFFYIVQEGTDLGMRMKNACLEIIQQGFQNVVILGSDVPELSGEIIKQAVDLLASKDVVLGPALDGGYYLIGLKKEPFYPELFYDISWSTEKVLQQTVSKLKQSHVSYSLLLTLDDIDYLADLRKYYVKNRDQDQLSVIKYINQHPGLMERLFK